MIAIPTIEKAVSDEEVFSAFRLETPELSPVRQALESGDNARAKKELVQYFQDRTNVRYLFDYRQEPLQKIDMDRTPYFFQASLGFGGSVKDFTLFAGKKMMQNIYVRPGRERAEVDLGKHYENLPHFSFLNDQGKTHRTLHDIFVRGQFFEYLAVLYHETGDREVLDKIEEVLTMFFEQYAIEIENTAPNANNFVFTQDRDVMSVGWLTFSYISLLYTRVPYELPYELAFELIRRIWFLGVQFRRFDTDTYRGFNHHMWERGLVPFMLGSLFPEIPAFAEMKSRGAKIVCRHVKEDYNEYGGYNEHSISYWSGASLGEMICRGIYLALVNKESLLDHDAMTRIENTFHILSEICPPGAYYPSLGDNGGAMVNPVLQLGVDACGSECCKELLNLRKGLCSTDPASLSLDYCNDKTGFVCTRNSFSETGTYILMSAKTSCGNSGHNHMDLLSLFLTFHGQEFIGEPHARQLYHNIRMGSPMRGYLYNMGSHNTVLAYERPVQPDEMYAKWYGVYRPDSPVNGFSSSEDGCFASAFHDAYTNCRHQRSLLFHRRKGLLVRDTIERATRLPNPHIQRWNLFPDVTFSRPDEGSVLLEKNGVRILAVWSGNPDIRVYRNTTLCPEFIAEEEKLSTIIDACFRVAPDAKPDVNTVSQDVCFLDVTDLILKKESVEEIRKEMARIQDLSALDSALCQFPDTNTLC